jgi:cbb3-type cytochrome oxidase cytochrome c subunit
VGRKLGVLWRLFFGDSARAFGTVSLLLLVSLVMAVAKDHSSPWRFYQRQYLSLVRGRSNAAALERHFHPGIQQTWLPDRGVADRCTTCHVALQESSLVDISIEPFRPHPPIPHSLAEFGCVTCHRGQGAATTVEEAHRSTKAWEQPLLPVKYLEASCGQCHLSALPGTPRLNVGRQLLSQYGCVRCHLIKQPDGTTVLATDNPPPLAHIAEKTSREWTFAWIKDPQAYFPSATMPNFALSDDDARDLSAALFAQSTPSRVAFPAVVPAAKVQGVEVQQLGARLYGEALCASCHAPQTAVQNVAGNLVRRNLGPDLTRLGSKVKSAWLEAWLRDPSAYNPETAMPHYRFNAPQAAPIAAFLEAKTAPRLLEGVHLSEATPQQIARGRFLLMERGCARCHEINGIRKPENFAPEQTLLGSKPLAQIAFAAGTPHNLADYIADKIRNPRAFAVSLKMPRFKLTDPQIDALTTALLALTDRAQTQPAAFRFISPPSPPALGKASQTINDLRCFSCHPNKGHEGYIARDLTWEGSVVSADWLEDFLRNPTRCGARAIGASPSVTSRMGESSTTAAR